MRELNKTKYATCNCPGCNGVIRISYRTPKHDTYIILDGIVFQKKRKSFLQRLCYLFKGD